jgi:hypothetical protein
MRQELALRVISLPRSSCVAFGLKPTLYMADPVLEGCRLERRGRDDFEPAQPSRRMTELDQTTANQERELRQVAERIRVHVYKDHGK